MRKISSIELPSDCIDKVLIKNSLRKKKIHHEYLINNTLRQCNKLREMHLLESEKIQKNIEERAIATVIDFIASELINVIFSYEKIQQEYLEEFKLSIFEKIQQSILDPSIVELIINKIAEDFAMPKNKLTVMLPTNIKIPNGYESSQFGFYDEQSITVKYNNKILRFPLQKMIDSWKKDEEEATTEFHNKTYINIFNILSNVCEKYKNQENDFNENI